MGIGNLLRRPGRSHQDVLLITPHGDRKPSLGATAWRRCVGSLPLMGIGNRFPGIGGTDQVQPSLPLMGIGNLSHDETNLRRCIASLPLMGIGNALNLDAFDPYVQVCLITPHGDRKLRVSHAVTVRAMVPSLPLMGIGNRRANRMAFSNTVDSLPLMGIGNITTVTGGSAVVCTHYPSWGSETFERPDLTVDVLDLITPHGDRKPRSSCSSTWTTTTAHYPSWGSETDDMGNRAHNLIVPHYPSWGSETAGAVRSCLQIAALITPHGDRKPEASHGTASLAIRSLPLMGIGNHVHSAGLHREIRLITPHGDRKRGRSLDYLIRQTELITPHGDRKRLCRIGGAIRPKLLITPHGDRKRFKGREGRSREVTLITPHGDRKL